MMRRLCWVAAVLAALASDATAAGKIARCHVESGGAVVVDGRCRFEPDRDGSFHLGNVAESKPLFDDVELLGVAIVSRDVAEVRGLTAAGINSRWGEARRSAQDRACWEGADFRICAY